jgi:integrase
VLSPADRRRAAEIRDDQEQRLRAVILRDYKWHYPEFQLALNCGIRPSEQFGLTWNQVSFERRQITIQLSKTGRARHVSLNSEAMTALRAVWERPVRKDRVFLGVDGQPLTGYRHWFEPAIKKAGLKDFTRYSLRHTFASRLAMAGVNIRTVAGLMGHRTIQMTMRYAHLAPEHNLAAVEKLVEFSADTKTDTETSTAILRMQ